MVKFAIAFVVSIRKGLEFGKGGGGGKYIIYFWIVVNNSSGYLYKTLVYEFIY